jgi:nucleoside-diphosphate-sugar epimerase
MAKIAVTGHTGFIGRHLVKALAQTEHTIIRIDRNFTPVACDRIYHLACPSITKVINENPTYVMDTIFDATRAAMKICPSAQFINASSYGAGEVAEGAQNAYNIAKRAMEIYLEQSRIDYINYRLPSVYGEEAHDDSFVVRCVQGTAYLPPEPDKMHYIAHVDDVVEAMINLTVIPVEEITLGQIYELFNFGRRGLHRPALNQGTV